MSRLLLVVSFWVLAAGAAAQAIPNGNFENWNGTLREDPLWYPYISNAAALAAGLPPNVVKVPDPQDGSFAVSVRTVSNAADTMFGYIINGDPNTGAGGIPYSEHPITLSGHYKCSLPSDTAILFIAFKEAGAVISTNYAFFTGVQNSYTYFYIPLTIPALAHPDSLLFGVISCNPSVPNPAPGSWIQLDNMLFNGVPTQPAQMNGSFEQWAGEYSWLLPQWESFGDTSLRSTDAHSGVLALQLTTVLYNANTAGPSVATTGHIYQNSVIGGRPYTLTNDTICGWYKFLVNGVDSAVGGGVAMLNGTPVGAGLMAFPPVPNYTYFEIPLLCAQQPDSLIMLFVSSADNTLPSNAGSRFYLDDLFLKSSPLAVQAYDWSRLGMVTLYPNPVQAGAEAVLEFSSEQPVLIMVYDAAGKEISSLQSSEKGLQRHALPTYGWSPGIYTVLLQNGQAKAVRKLVVE